MWFAPAQQKWVKVGAVARCVVYSRTTVEHFVSWRFSAWGVTMRVFAFHTQAKPAAASVEVCFLLVADCLDRLSPTLLILCALTGALGPRAAMWSPAYGSSPGSRCSGPEEKEKREKGESRVDTQVVSSHRVASLHITLHHITLYHRTEQFPSRLPAKRQGWSSPKPSPTWVTYLPCQLETRRRSAGTLHTSSPTTRTKKPSRKAHTQRDQTQQMPPSNQRSNVGSHLLSISLSSLHGADGVAPSLLRTESSHCS